MFDCLQNYKFLFLNSTGWNNQDADFLLSDDGGRIFYFNFKRGVMDVDCERQKAHHLLVFFLVITSIVSSTTIFFLSAFFLSQNFLFTFPAIFHPQVIIKTWWRWVKPVIFRPCEYPCLKSIGFWKKNPNQPTNQKKKKEWIGCGRRSGLLNIKQQVSGEMGNSCGDAVSDPISISCSPARLQQWLHSDFYSTRQATPGTVTLSGAVIATILYTNHDRMHLCLSHLWRGQS